MKKDLCFCLKSINSALFICHLFCHVLHLSQEFIKSCLILCVCMRMCIKSCNLIHGNKSHCNGFWGEDA